MPASARFSTDDAPDVTPSPTADFPDAAEKELEALRNRNPQAVRTHLYGNKDFLQGVLRRYTETEETAQDLL